MKTQEEFVAELQRLMAQRPKSDPGMTAWEIIDAVPYSDRSVRGMLKRGVKAGTLVVGWRYEPNVIGRTIRVPVYMRAKDGKATKPASASRTERNRNPAGALPGRVRRVAKR